MPTTKQVAYTLYFQKGGKLYQLMSACSNLELSEEKETLAQTLTFDLASVKADGTYIGSILDPGDIIHLTCNDGDRKGELFRGPIWEANYSHDGRSLSYTAYDPLIYLKQSKDALYFPKGRDTKQIFETVCNKWGIPLEYTYTTIKHDKVGGTAPTSLSDFFFERLKEVRDKTHLQWTLLYQDQKLIVRYRGSNQTVYTLTDNTNLTSAEFRRSMDNVITQIIITGEVSGDKSDESAAPIEATMKGTTKARYGTIQDVKAREDKQTLAQAKEEAQKTLWENRLPKNTFLFESVDYPFMRVGDIVNVESGANAGYSKLCVKSITHNFDDRTMRLELET